MGRRGVLQYKYQCQRNAKHPAQCYEEQGLYGPSCTAPAERGACGGRTLKGGPCGVGGEVIRT